MFALIIAIIAIGLTVFLAVTTITYFNEDGNAAAKAEAGRIIQEASQIRGAILIARTDGLQLSTDSTLYELTPEYLSDVPKGAENWRLGYNQVFHANVNDTVCLAANASLNYFFTAGDTDVREAEGGGYIPYCDNPDLSGNVPCCDVSRQNEVAPE